MTDKEFLNLQKEIHYTMMKLWDLQHEYRGEAGKDYVMGQSHLTLKDTRIRVKKEDNNAKNTL